MNPTRFTEVNTVMRRPQDMTEEECCDVHAYADGNKVITAWQPTPEELVKLNLGVPVFLCVCGSTMPPVSLSVGKWWDDSNAPRD